jgi:beta-carotene 15,15'-dioxygenase
MNKKIDILNYKTEIFLLLIGFSVIFYHYLILPISGNQQLFILFSFVLIVGVPHGALDYLVDEQNKKYTNNVFSLKKFLIIYLTRLFAFALLWILPWFAFSLFIIFSIFHFGETDMSSVVKPNKYAFIVYYIYGSLILSILLLSHLSEIELFLPVVSIFLKENNIYNFLIVSTPYIVSFFSIAFLLILFFQKKKGFINKITFYQVLQFLGLLIILIFLPLALAFTFYFAIWHSILSIRNIYCYFKSFNNNKKNKYIYGKSLLFSGLALGAIIALYFAVNFYIPSFNMLFASLIILSVLTLPHLTVMHDMYKNSAKLPS